MAKQPKIEIVFKMRRLGRHFFARPCDDGRRPKWAWCVEEVEVKADLTLRWASTLYEPVKSRLANGNASIAFTHMTKAQARREAKLWQQEYELKQ